MKVENLDQNTSRENDQISLKELILNFRDWYRYLLTKWLIILLFGILGGILGFVYAYYKKPVYTAATTFVLEDGASGGGGMGNLGGIASMVGLDMGSGGGIFQGDNILELYKSRSMIQRALMTEVENEGKKELLVNWYLDLNKIRDTWQKNELLRNVKFKVNQYGSNSNFTRLQDSILGSIVNDLNKNSLSVSKPDKKLSIIKVEVKSNNEFFAKAFNEQIVRNVNDFYIQTKTKKSLENVNIIQLKTDSVRRVMNGDIYAAAVVTDATPNLNPTRQVQRTAPVQRSQFSAETNKAILQELVKNLEMSKISLRKETPLLQVIDQPVYPLQRQALGKAKAIVLGGILAGFLCICSILIKKMFSEIFK